MTKKLVILGSTGSIGRQTLDVVRHLPVQVVGLTAGSNVDRMLRQIREFHPRLVSMATQSAALELQDRLQDPSVTVLWGEEGLLKAASMDETDTVITAVVGMVGLKPTLAALSLGRRVGLANKETMVCAGELVMQAAKQHGGQIIPVDSEHSAIFQCLMGSRDRGEVKDIILTCSGGPFFGMTKEELAGVTKHDALKHPNWRMGEKITIDCATLMNKGLEVIEAMRLYELPAEQVKVVIHRQSIVHSLVEFVDGAMLAQLGVPDMRIPIQLALTYPNRTENPAPGLDLFSCPPLTFCQPDTEAFPCLAIAMEAAKAGGTACAAMNGANEVAVALYLQEQIGFYDIPRLVRLGMDAVPFTARPDLDQILEADRLARQAVISSM